MDDLYGEEIVIDGSVNILSQILFSAIFCLVTLWYQNYRFGVEIPVQIECVKKSL